ncbi:nuclear transport factor 2 family protein [Inhella proteolytica]|uniref:Nuclear transport factor 2 family protein n=1 Tax=Inhella proteolytica TaxID=2795029 RepID=A0A931J8T4_9BURK|nr:nuclear transport factor 2 family protein [Inhella proteolytica]MBH9578892.1 nuclear transport factor 2 family protein [Inhella proteolytica]
MSMNRAQALTALLGLPLLAQASAAEDATLALLRTQADRWDQAIVAKDRAAIEANMGADFRQIDGAGNLEDKASFVAGLLDPQLQIEPYTVEDFEIRLYGEVALLSGRTRMRGRYAGKAFESHYRYIDVYVRRNGIWQIVSVQISKIAP